MFVAILPIALLPFSAKSQGDEISADTGRMRIPYVDWSEYTTPGMCVAASRNVQHLTDRVGVRGQPGFDTVVYTIEHDTLSTAALQISQRCSERFTIEHAASEDVYPLFQIALQAGNDSQAQAALERRLSLAMKIPEKSRTLRQAVETYLGASPPRVSLAIAALQKLDALGFEARVERIVARIALMQHYQRVFDIDNAVHQADSLIVLLEMLKPEDIEQGVYVNAVLAPYSMKSLKYLIDDPSKLESAYTDRLVRGETIKAYLPTRWAEQQRRVAEQYLACCVMPLGTPVPPMTGKYVFNANGSTTRPLRGKVSILLQAPANWRDGFGYSMYAAIRHLHRKYGSAVDIVLFTKTLGYTRGSLAQTPDEEAESIREYFLDHQKLPVTLIVDESPVTLLPDGRRTIGMVPYEEVFKGMGMIVAGPDKTYQRVYLGLFPDHLIYRMIDRVVQQYTAAGASESMGSSPDSSSSSAANTNPIPQ